MGWSHFRRRGGKAMAVGVAVEGNDATDYSCHAMIVDGGRRRNCGAAGARSGVERTKTPLERLPRETLRKMM